MKFTLEYPSEISTADPALSGPEALSLVSTQAEHHGFEALCFADHPAPSAKWRRSGGHDTFEPTVALAFFAAATTSLKLMTNLYVLPFRNPYLAAKALTSLDIVSGGRLIAAVGAGYLRSEFSALGVDFDQRPALFDDRLDALRRIWTTPGAPASGEGFAAHSDMALHAPTQKPHPPIWIGGNSNAAIRRVVKHGVGWCPVLAPDSLTSSIRTAPLPDLSAFARRMKQLRAALEDSGRDPDSVAVQVESPSVDLTDPQSIRRCRERIDELDALGVTHVCVHADADSVAAAEDFVFGFGETVIAAGA